MTFPNFFVITGGPGMGKTSIIGYLLKCGYACIPETGRAIIRGQIASGGDALPWKDRLKYAEAMFKQSIVDFDKAFALQQPVFFDRGIPDVAGYLQICGITIPSDIIHASQNYRYANKVFIAPPWKEIYENDNERKQSFNEAVRTYEIMLNTYETYGYDVVEIPKCSVEQRAEFVITNI